MRTRDGIRLPGPGAPGTVHHAPAPPSPHAGRRLSTMTTPRLSVRRNASARRESCESPRATSGCHHTLRVTLDDVVVAVVAEHDLTVIVVERHSVGSVYVGLPHPVRPLHLVGFKPWMAGVFDNPVDAFDDCGHQPVRLLAESLLESRGKNEPWPIRHRSGASVSPLSHRRTPPPAPFATRPGLHVRRSATQGSSSRVDRPG